MKKRYFSVVILLLVAAVVVWLLFFREKPTQNQVEVSGEGYRSMAVSNGKLYVVENNGGIYTLDWDTGKKEHVYSAPESISWVSAPDMSAIYYIDANVLYRVDLATGQETQVCPLEGQSMSIMAVTEHYVLCQGTRSIYADIIQCVNVETGGQYTLLEGPEITGDERFSREVYAVAGEGDVAYGLFRRSSVVEYPDESEYWFEAWDLSTGGRTVLAQTNENGHFLDNVTTANGLFYFQQDDGVWAVPLDGSGTAECMIPKDALWVTVEAALEDGRLICTMGLDGNINKFYIYEPETGEFAEFFNMESEVSVKGFYTCGDAYALWCWDNGQSVLMIGDLPTGEEPTVAEQMGAVLPDLLMAMNLIETEDAAERVSIGQPIKMYRCVNAMLEPGDADVYPIYLENEMVCLVYPYLQKTGEYTFTAGVDYAATLQAFVEKTGAEKIALIEDKNGVQCVTENGESGLMCESYNELKNSIAILREEQLEEAVKPFSLENRIG